MGNRRLVILVLGILGIILIFLVVRMQYVTPSMEQSTPAVTVVHPSQSPMANTLPTTQVQGTPTPPTPIPASSSAPQSPFGAEMKRLDQEAVFSLAQESRLHWLRYNGLFWADVELTAGARQWENVAELEQRLQAAYAAGLQTILIVRQTPNWAQKVPDSTCGPVAPDALDDLAQFMADAVARYKDPPYGVKYWEIGNEPDVDPSMVNPASPFGCWGDLQDPYFGGGYYAQMLQVVYPAIKEADPEAQVLIGGLLLDTDPAQDENLNPPGRFLEGILKGGGGDFFDVVGFHGYVWYDGQQHDWESLVPKWAHRGGLVAGKASFLRETLAEYGYDKPLMLNEGGLICWQCPEPLPADYLAAQAVYITQLNVRNIARGLQATIWYTFDGPGWQGTGLLDKGQQPQPAYYAFKAMTALLEDAVYLRPIDENLGLEGYAFQKSAGEIWVLWAPDGSPIALTLPPGLSQVYDLYGTPLMPDRGALEIGFHPVYLELPAP